MNTPLLKKQTDLLRAPELSDIPLSILLLIVSRGSVMDFFPFGIALFCACFDKKAAYLGITLMYIGLISAGAGDIALKYMIAGLCFWLFTSFVSIDKKKLGAAACSGAVLIGGILDILRHSLGLYLFVALIAEVAAVYMLYEVFTRAYSYLKNPSKEPARDELISCAIAAGALIMGMSGIPFPYGIKLSHILSVYILLLSALNLSTSSAAAMGITVGFISGIDSGAVTLAGVMGLGAVFASILSGYKKIGTALGFIGGFGIALLYLPSASPLPLGVWETASAAVLFILTPKRLTKKLTSVFTKPELKLKDPNERAADYMCTRVESCARAFSSLKTVFEGATKKRMDIYNYEAGSLFDDISSRVCQNCQRYYLCYEREFTRTYNMLLEMLDKTERKGYLNINSLPLSFRENCICLDELIKEFSHAYEIHRSRLVHIDELKTGRDLCALQYGEIADILDRLSADAQEGFMYCPELELMCLHELNAHGIKISSLEISQNRFEKYEILLCAPPKTDMNMVCGYISKILMTNIGVDKEIDNGVFRLVTKPCYSVDVGIMQKSKEKECGDSISVFTVDDYKLYCIISDGMGCGRKARTESDITITLLREFISAGFSVKTSISMINSAMCLKADHETFSTIDLTEIDLITGTMQFYKIGSAISLLYSNGEVSSVYSVSLPAGMLPRVQIRAQSKRAEDGTVLLMVSDGITEAGEIKTDWLKAQLKTPHESMQELAEDIINEASKKSGECINDDMSVISVMIKKAV